MSGKRSLNQDEIDAAAEGRRHRRGEDRAQGAAGARDDHPFQLQRHDRVVRSRMAALDIIHDRFIKLLTATFSRSLHRAVEVKLQSTETVKFGTLMERLSLPSSLVIFKMDTLPAMVSGRWTLRWCTCSRTTTSAAGASRTSSPKAASSPDSATDRSQYRRACASGSREGLERGFSC